MPLVLTTPPIIQFRFPSYSTSSLLSQFVKFIFFPFMIKRQISSSYVQMLYYSTLFLSKRERFFLVIIYSLYLFSSVDQGLANSSPQTKSRSPTLCSLFCKILLKTATIFVYVLRLLCCNSKVEQV